MTSNLAKILIITALIATLAACSTTSRLAEGEVLYTGVKKIQYNQPDSVKIADEVKENVKFMDSKQNVWQLSAALYF